MQDPTAKWFDTVRGCDCIEGDGVCNDLFAHVSSDERAGLPSRAGVRRVRFEPRRARKGSASGTASKAVRPKNIGGPPKPRVDTT